MRVRTKLCTCTLQFSHFLKHENTLGSWSLSRYSQCINTSFPDVGGTLLSTHGPNVPSLFRLICLFLFSCSVSHFVPFPFLFSSCSCTVEQNNWHTKCGISENHSRRDSTIWASAAGINTSNNIAVLGDGGHTRNTVQYGSGVKHKEKREQSE